MGNFYTPARRESWIYKDPHVRPSITLFKFDYGVFHIYRSWVMALFLVENRDFLGFRMIFKVWLNQIFSNFNTMLWTIKYRLSSITVYFTFTVPELWPFFS